MIREKVEGVEFLVEFNGTDPVFPTRMTTCNTSIVREGYVMTDGVDEFTVIGYELDSFIELDNPFAGKSLSIKSPLPKVLSGTPRFTNGEYTDLGNVPDDKLPLVWILEPYTDYVPERTSSIGREFDGTIFFLDDASEQLTGSEHHNEVTKRMDRLSQLVFSSMESDYMFKSLDRQAIKPRVRFGRNGKEEILNDILSGVEVKLSFERYKEFKCKC